MKNAVKLYTTFIPTIALKWIVYLVYPIVLLMMSTVFCGYYLSCALFIMPLIYGAELFINILMFRGIASDEPLRIEYLHTSGKGLRLFGDALLFDYLRRFVTVFAIMILPEIYDKLISRYNIASFSIVVDGENKVLSPIYYLTAALLLIIVIEIEVFLARKINGATIIFLISFFGYLVCLLQEMMIFAVPAKRIIVTTVIFAVIYLIVISFSYNNIMEFEERKISDFIGKE